MLNSEHSADAASTAWRKLAHGLHARHLVDDFGTGARFVTAVAEAGDALGHHPEVSVGAALVDLEVVGADAIHREDDGTEHVLERVYPTRRRPRARRITEIVADHGLTADPAAVSVIELGLATARSATIAPVWAVLLTGDAAAQGRGTPGDEIRDATGRVPHLWSRDDDDQSSRQRFHVEVHVPPEVAAARIAAAAIAAGGVLADQDGDHTVVCVDVSAATTD